MRKRETLHKFISSVTVFTHFIPKNTALYALTMKYLLLNWDETETSSISAVTTNSTDKMCILSSAAFHKCHENSLKHAFLGIVSYESLFSLDTTYAEK